ncbi:hypothetical protein QZH41_014734, partial [Actinostola sp. cb2023]
ALVAGLATGIPVIFLVFIYVTYCCCKRKQKDELLQQEPRLWRRDVRARSSHDLFIPAYVPRFVQKFVQNSSKHSSETSSTQTSPVDDKTFFSEGSEPYRTAPDDMGGAVDWPGGLSELQIPEARRSSLLQPSTSSGESSESTYEHTPKKCIGPRSPRSASASASDSKSFEFVRPIPVKPLITITRAESLSKDDLNARLESTMYTADTENVRQAHSDSHIIQARDLPCKDLRRNTSSPYVRVYALPSRRHNHRTNVITNNLNPTFNELFIISGLTLMEVQQLSLQILIIHNEIISRNVVIGEVMVALPNLDLAGGETQLWRDIRPYHFQNVLGELHISVCHQPLSSRLSVTVLQARNLPKISNLNIGGKHVLSSRDPYVKNRTIFITVTSVQEENSRQEENRKP